MAKYHRVCFALAFIVGFFSVPIFADSQDLQSKQGSAALKPSADGSKSDAPLRRMATVPIKDNPKLPRVLLIGDSIAMGYTLPLRELLKDKANVHFPHENCHSSRDILRNIEAYLGDKSWDVIQFNCGIHDVTLLNDAGRSIKEGEQGKQRVALDEYRDNLEKIITRFQKTGVALIWCSTTPVDDNLPHRKPEDIVRYNAVAAEIMQKHGIPITDLHKLTIERGDPKWSDGVHFTIEGSHGLARDEVSAIEAALAKRAVSNR